MIGALLKWMLIGLLTFACYEVVLCFIFKGRRAYMISYLKQIWNGMGIRGRLAWILLSIPAILLASVIWPIKLICQIIEDYKNRNLIRENITNGL